MRERVRLLIMAATLALAASLVVAAPAHAVETSAVRVEAVAFFNDGNVGWYKLVLEKNTSTNQGRIKITAWCEPDSVLGGTKVPCDAIKYGTDKAVDPTGQGRLTADYWNEGLGWSFSNVARVTDQDITAYYSPRPPGTPLTAAGSAVVWAPTSTVATWRTSPSPPPTSGPPGKSV